MKNKGIFCLEGLWDNDLRKISTVEPILSLLHRRNSIPYIYRDCGTLDEFKFYLNIWPQKRYRNYPVLYLAFHGKKGVIHIGRDKCKLDEIGDELAGKCRNTFIVIGACETLDIDKRYLNKFIDTTGALAVCGYKAVVDWMKSTAFELLIMDTLQENAFDRRGIPSIKKKLTSLSKSFKDLGFRIVA
ncbi:MAG TPA: hypothetical protein PK528_02390 [Syntrophorhabdus sp.]|nr:hypothetical protein [Syntrophorhabdus sp.]